MELLKGKTVLDLTRLLPGGFCSHILSELGAKVVKVEEPVRGDYMRSLPATGKGTNVAFSMINRGKESIGLNLKFKEGREILAELASDCDVFFEGFRPGVMKKLGFSFENVKKMNSRIVYCSISAFGQSSTLSSTAAHDLNYQALSGVLFARGAKPAAPLIQCADLCAGMYAAIGIVAALASKRKDAVFIDIPIVQSLMSLMIIPVSFYLATNQLPKHGQGPLFGGDPYYNLYRTADNRFMAVAALEKRFRTNLLNELGLPQLEDVAAADGREWRFLKRKLEDVFMSKKRDEWVNLLMKRDTCVTPVFDLAEAMSSTWAREVFGKDTLRTPFYEGPPNLGMPKAPGLGEHTERILRRFGYSRGKINKMREEGIVS